MINIEPTNVNEWNQKCVNLIEQIKDGQTFEQIAAHKNLIAELAEECRRKKLYAMTADKRKEFKKTFHAKPKDNAIACYFHMVCKVAEAPTKIHADGVMILTVPLLDQFVKEALEVSE